MPRHAQVELAVGQVAARVDDGADIAIDDEELVGLHGLTTVVAQVGKHQAGVVGAAEQLLRHGGLPSLDVRP